MKDIVRKMLCCMVVFMTCYIRYLRTEIEILRFDCMMKQMKENEYRSMN